SRLDTAAGSDNRTDRGPLGQMPDETDEEQYQRGLALQRDGRFGEAVDVYLPLARRVLTVKLATNLGIALGALGDARPAIHYLKRAADHRPDDAALTRTLGRAYGEAGEVALAEQAYLKVLAANPDDAPAQLALSGVYLSMGGYAEGWPLMGV